MTILAFTEAASSLAAEESLAKLRAELNRVATDIKALRAMAPPDCPTVRRLRKPLERAARVHESIARQLHLLQHCDAVVINGRLARLERVRDRLAMARDAARSTFH